MNADGTGLANLTNDPTLEPGFQGDELSPDEADIPIARHSVQCYNPATLAEEVNR